MRLRVLLLFSAFLLLSPSVVAFPPEPGRNGLALSIGSGSPLNSGSTEADAALGEARKLLGRYRADLAYNFLQQAQRLYAQANDGEGQALVLEGLGDVYAQSGQFVAALENYRRAYESFKELEDTDNANAMLAKIGERHLLLGDIEAARAAFAAMNVSEPAKRREGAGIVLTDDRDGDNKSAAAIVSLGACLTPGAGNSSRQNNDPHDPPNQGRAPGSPNGIGRLDLRIRDEAGRPVQGVRAQIQSTRPGGLYCECWDTTDAFGRAVMPPLHIAPQIRLVLRAPGKEQYELVLNAERLSQPVNVVLSKTGASLAQVQPLPRAPAAPSCLELFRDLVAFASKESGEARALYFGGRLRESREKYENLLAQLGLPAFTNSRIVARFRVAALTSLGDVALRENRLEEAARFFERASAVAREDNRLDLLWAAQRGLGRALWLQSIAPSNAARAGRLRSDSVGSYLAAVRAVETLRAGSLRADEARSSFLSTTKDLYDEAALVLTRMALIATGEGKMEEASRRTVQIGTSAGTFTKEAFAVIERGRARSLLDMLGEARAGITEGIPPELLRRREEIVARQQEIARSLTGVSVPSNAPGETILQLETELERLNSEYDGVENQIRTRSPRYASLSGSDPLTFEEVRQNVLDEDTALVVYVLGWDESLAWVVTRAGVSVNFLPPRVAVETQVEMFRAQLIPTGLRRSIFNLAASSEGTRSTPTVPNAQSEPAPARARTVASYARAAFALYGTLLAPSATTLGSKRLLVLADGALNFVPFEALITDPSPDATEYGELPYLVKTNEVVYAPSASVVDASRKRSPSPRASAGPVLVVADPVFSPADSRAKTTQPADSTAVDELRGLALERALEDVAEGETAEGDDLRTTRRLRIARLINTRNEAREIAEFARSARTTADVWLDLAASESKVTASDVSRYGVIHFATHGLLNSKHPQFSGLVLSQVGEREADGFLRVSEVFNFKLGSPLVMLSACETGLGREKRGEGVIGLARAFTYAGAPTVGVSLWTVSDRSTAALMSDFYGAYFAAGGTRPAAAMRSAQLKMISSSSYSPPFYWAPFIVIGDWN